MAANSENDENTPSLAEDDPDRWPLPIPLPDGYVTLVARLWIGDGGTTVRGSLQDAHSGARLAIDLSPVVALLRRSLAARDGGTAEGGRGNAD